MSEDTSQSVMRRMARLGQQEYAARAMSPAKALRLSLARAADKVLNMPLVVTALEQVRIAHADLGLELAQGGLLALLDGPAGEGGAMRIDPGLLSAIVEMQTTGHVTGRNDTPRAVTRTDAAMAAPLIDGMLERIETCLQAEPQAGWSPYRYGVMMADARALSLAMMAVDYTCFRVMLEIGEQAHPGALTLIVPHLAARDTPEAGTREASETQEDNAALANAVTGAPVTLDAVLGRITMPLDALCALAAGDTLPVAREQVLNIRLESAQKHLVSHARLGQLNGARAARLTLAGGADAGQVTDGAPAPEVRREPTCTGDAVGGRPSDHPSPETAPQPPPDPVRDRAGAPDAGNGLQTPMDAAPDPVKPEEDAGDVLAVVSAQHSG